MNVIEPFLRQALAHPERQALITAHDELSYRTLSRAVRQAAARLHAAGVRRHDRVGLEVGSSVVHVVLTLAVAWLGAVSVVLATGSRRAAANGRIARACGLGFAVHDGPAEQAPDYPGLKAALAVADLMQGPASARVPWVRVAPDELFRIGPSSGTARASKPVAYSHRGFLLKCQLLHSMFPCGTGERVMTRLGVGLPFGQNFWLRALLAGDTVLLFPGGSAAQANAAIRKYGVTQLVTTPRYAMDLLGDAREPGSPHAEPAPHLALMVTGGGAAPRRLRESLKRHLCPGLHVTYGAAEIGLIALADPQLQEADPGCAGQLMPWVEAQAVNDAGTPLAAGRTGRLRFRSPGMATGYVQEHADGGEALRDGWFYASDTGSVSREGRVYLAAPAKAVPAGARKRATGQPQPPTVH